MGHRRTTPLGLEGSSASRATGKTAPPWDGITWKRSTSTRARKVRGIFGVRVIYGDVHGRETEREREREREVGYAL